MKKTMLAFLRLALFGVAVAFSASVSALADAKISDAGIADALRKGGYVIVIRHGATHRDQADTDPLHPDNIAQQRQLNEKGEAAAAAMGKAFKAIGIPIGKTVTSHFNRAYQTAKIAGFDNIEKSPDVSEGGQVVSPNENDRRTKAMRTLASTVPAPGTNVVIISHKPNVVDTFGKDWFEIKEGEASIFKPDGQGYTLFVRLQMDEWTRIAEAVKK